MAGQGWRSEMTVVTPESVSFSYEVAGIGSRFMALLIDHSLGFGLIFAILFVVGLLQVNLSFWGQRALIYGSVLFAFIIYFILFESLWEGQTPGKRLMHLRVVREGGYGLTFLSSLLRNLVRIMDFLPFLYFFGFISMFLSNKSRRLGDLAAGTLVVKDWSGAAPQATRIARGNILAGMSAETQLAIRGRAPLLGGEELRLMRQFMRRRTALAPEARRTLAAKLAAVIRTNLHDVAEIGDETLIEAVVAADEERQT